ncbi:MotA/TolQ/ExbB proton channel family protein [Botrimarina sp.]|uniref:MotA/TolQ/ExbB proton channel family protein n=1 Tax=Botrimarina sp. TaxID=2795802 RepID=UPI0032EC7228
MAPINVLANWLLRLPLLWGGLATLAFYASLQTGLLPGKTMQEYFASHPIEYVATLLFFVGSASLVMRLVGLAGQFGATRLEPLGPAPAAPVPATDAAALLSRLDALRAPVRRSRLVARLREALEYIRDSGSADTLDEQLARLAEADRDRAATAYALPRLVRAVLPIVGMLGTVVGITMALGTLSLAADQLEDSLNKMIPALAVAFITTTQAMGLMLVLWFAMFGVEQVEERLLNEIDRAAARQLIGRFQQYGSQHDPNVAAVRRMCEQVVGAIDRLTATQVDSWRDAIDETNAKWREATAGVGELLTTTLSNGLRDGLRDHATGLTNGVEKQLAQLAEGLRGQQSQVGAAIRDQFAMLSKLHAEHADAIRTTTQRETERIVTGADGLLGNLRDGLERMAELLVEALEKHGETLTAAEHELASENRRHLGEVEAALGEAMVVAADRQEKLIRRSEEVVREMQQALVAGATATLDQQKELVRQGEVLTRVVESTGQVARLEEALNRNLSTLGRTHNFEETLMSLSAAIQLLSARVGREPAAGAPATAPSKAAPKKAA